MTFCGSLWRRFGSGRLLSHSVGCEAREERLIRASAHPPSFTGCPIEVEEFVKVESVPEDAAYQGEEAGEAVRPFAEEGLEPQQHIKKERDPDLPADGVGAVAEEIAELEGLLDLLEEDLDLPAAAVEVGNGGWGPIEVVR